MKVFSHVCQVTYCQVTYCQIGLALAIGLSLTSPSLAQSVTTTPGTGNVGTQINNNNNRFTITGGTQRLNTLFHSFENFSPEATDVLFQLNNTQQTVEHVIGRVTGNQTSVINANLALTGGNSPHLFLINPYGITFGANASLSLPGAFTASTADTLLFNNDFTFDTTLPNSAPLLTVSAPIGLQFGSQLGSATPAAITINEANLAVAANSSLSLLGGDITLNGGSLTAAGGHIQLGGLANRGTIDLSQPRFTVTGERSNLILRNQADVDVSATIGGQLTINTNNLQLSDSSYLQSVTTAGSSANTISGNVVIDATGDVSLSDRSEIRNELARDTLADGGNLTLNAHNLNLTDGSKISIENSGSGNAGELVITATGNIDIISDYNNDIISRIDAEVDRRATGNGGNITINTHNLNLTDGGRISLEVEGAGQGGSLWIFASGDININGHTANETVSRIDAESNNSATGNGGNVTIEAANINLTNGGLITLETESSGHAGDLFVRASGDINVIGVSPNRGRRSRFFSESDNDATGNAGNVTIETTNLKLANGGGISVETEGTGNAGNVTIQASGTIELTDRDPVNGSSSKIDAEVGRSSATGSGGDINLTARRLQLIDGGSISVETKGSGNAGNININVTEDVIVRIGENNFVTRIAAEVDDSGTGQGGNISINTRNLQLINGGKISVETEGTGNAGLLTIRAQENIEVIGFNQARQEPSRLEAQVDDNATGNGGNIILEANHLSVRDGGSLSIDTFGSGQGGNATIRTHSIELSGDPNDTTAVSKLTAAAITDAPAGSFNIQTSQLSLENNSLIEVSSAGLGGAGNLTIAADQISLNHNASLQALVTAGDQGNISISATDFVLLRNGSSITTTATETASGGNININTPILIGLENSDIIANAVQGQGGNINLSTQGIFGLVFRDQLTPQNDITASSEFGLSGTVEINTLTTQPATRLAQLPDTPADPNNQVASACSINQVNQFITSGRGGIPTYPSHQLNTAQPWQDLRNLAVPPLTSSSEHLPTHQSENVEITATENQVAIEDETKQITQGSQSNLIEAHSWQRNNNGQIELLTVRENQPVTPQLSTCLTHS